VCVRADRSPVLADLLPQLRAVEIDYDMRVMKGYRRFCGNQTLAEFAV